MIGALAATPAGLWRREGRYYGLSNLPVEGGLKVVDGDHEGIPAAECPDQLDRSADLGEGRDAQHGGVVEVEDAFVGILGQQRVEHGAGLIPVSGERVPLPDVVALAIDAKSDEAARWYERLGAQPLLDDPLKLILPLAVVAEALASSGTRP